MTYTITNKCIGCQRCLSVCATGAVQTDGSTVWIEASQCNQCADDYRVPQCWAVCPTNEGCVPLVSGAAAVALTSSGSGDYWESWFATYNRMVARLQSTQPSGYWRQWFDTYSQTLSQLRLSKPDSANLPLLP